jgi:curved DNA-binding protein
MNKNYYDILGISKSSSEAEIKKAYKKLAMQYHPDRNKGDKKAEEKFKEINEAYQVLGDVQKKKNYDQFGSSDGNPFGWMGGNPFWWQYSSSGSTNFSGFEDIFSGFGWMGQWWRWGFEFDIGDLFGNTRETRKQEKHTEKEKANLDVTETIEIPFLDFLYDTTLDIKTIYGKHLSLKIKAGTKPGTKFKISGKWRTIDGETGDMFVIVDAKMPKEIPEHAQKMIDAIRYEL